MSSKLRSPPRGLRVLGGLCSRAAPAVVAGCSGSGSMMRRRGACGRREQRGDGPPSNNRQPRGGFRSSCRQCRRLSAQPGGAKYIGLACMLLCRPHRVLFKTANGNPLKHKKPHKKTQQKPKPKNTPKRGNTHKPQRGQTQTKTHNQITQAQAHKETHEHPHTQESPKAHPHPHLLV
jgi:hypothetical protein